jgi:hypothetical protein
MAISIMPGTLNAPTLDRHDIPLSFCFEGAAALARAEEVDIRQNMPFFLAANGQVSPIGISYCYIV